MNIYLYAYTRVGGNSPYIYSGTVNFDSMDEVTQMLNDLIPEGTGGQILAIVRLL